MLKGSIQPAPSIRPWRMITAPSCMGAFTKKIFFSSSEETAASSVVPLRTMSSRWMSRSNTIKTPVLLWDISLHAMTVWSMAVSSSDCCLGSLNTRSSLMLRLPTFSNICRISGWNRMMIARIPTCTRFFIIYAMVFNCKMSTIHNTSRNATTPLRIFSARVLFTIRSRL